MPASVSGASRDGRYHLGYADGFAKLTVFPPSGKGKPVYVEDVVNRMKLLGVPRVRGQVISKVIGEASGEPVSIVEWPGGAILSASLDLSITDDKMRASIVMLPPQKGGSMLAVDDVIAFLKDNKVIYGILEEAIEDLIIRSRFGEEIVVARGKEKVDGVASHAVFSFNTDVGKPFLIMEGDRINLKELNFIQNKHEGDVLAEIIPEQPPQNGANVCGENIPGKPFGAALPVKPGKNTKLSEDGKSIISLIDGNAFIKSGSVNVEPVVVVNNVNYETGNIDFEGSVVVSKTIADGFSVKADGSIEVGECIGRAEVHAGRELILKGGVNAAHEGSLVSGGDLYVKFIESAKVYSGGHLYIQELIMHSSVTARGNILFKGKRGEIIGGTTIAGRSVWCKKIGSVSETPTRLTLGIEPDFLADFSRTLKKIEERKTRLDEIEADSTRLKRRISESERISQRLSQALQQLQSESSDIYIELDTLSKKANDYKRKLSASEATMLVVENFMYPGAVISFGREEYRVSAKGSQKTILKWIDRSISESGFNRADPPKLLFEQL